jgi:Zn-finger nucleic acid-binding protein
MKCPKCKTDNLTPTKLEQDFPSMGCKSCQGTLISLIYYRDWAERSTLPLAIDQLELEQVEDNDSKVALTCPKCGRVMNRYRISDQHQNRLDMCFSCGEAWIDSGEWDLLKSLDLIKNLPVIFTESWQKKISSNNYLNNIGLNA